MSWSVFLENENRISSVQIIDGIKADGNKFGYNAQKATAEVAVGWAGAWAGAQVGFEVGILARPWGALIGTVVGTIAGDLIGSSTAGYVYDDNYKK